MLLDRAASQYTATSSLDIDDGIHDDSLTKRFGDLLVRLPDDPSSGDGLKLDKGSTAALERSLEQSESPPLDDTPPLSLNLDGDVGNATNAPQSLVPCPPSEDCSSSSLYCDDAWGNVCMLFPRLLETSPNDSTSTLGLNLATITFGEAKPGLEGSLVFSSQEGTCHGLQADDGFFILQKQPVSTWKDH